MNRKISNFSHPEKIPIRELVEDGQRDTVLVHKLTLIHGFHPLRKAAWDPRMKAEGQGWFALRRRQFDLKGEIASNGASEKVVGGPRGAFEGQG